jgi:CheY-like chemotaxis protein
MYANRWSRIRLTGRRNCGCTISAKGTLQDTGIFPGGRSVAKILVADDNSNIQKMVGLALKDHGIDVVAVGNGEAAVRKISDIRPDLVLADVFMPVRNGYEVCKYVKDDPSLAHIPVILLVGAFDPLDEQEAQRVGADGVLKKPFVPPDPLISMVKSALVRAGVAHAGFTPAKPVPEAPVEVPEPAPSRNANPNVAAKPEPPLPDFDTSFVEEVPARPVALTIDSGKQPVAFGNLLETETEEEPTVTAVPALERDWRTAEVEEEEQEEESDGRPSWRRDAGDEEGEDKAASSGIGWRESAPGESPGPGEKHSGWTPTREKEDLTEAAALQDNVSAAASDFRNIPAVPFSGEAWAAAIEAGVQNKTAVAEEEHPTPHAAELEALVGHAEPATAEQQEESFVSEPEPVVEEVSVVPALVSQPEIPSAPSWFSTPPNPWEAEAQKASRLASTWDAPAPAVSPTPVKEMASVPVEARAFATAEAPDEIEVVSSASAPSVIPEAVETLREEVSRSAADVDMDAVVARVLARLGPEKLQEVTRDLLKPLIEAVVREELDKKS